ncbi:MAG: oxygenase MpaB family protein [Janthinobacterium lividum]
MPSHASSDPLSLEALVLQPVRRAITSQVVALFNDQARGDEPVVRQDDGLFGPDSVAWRVHGDVASMMVGGISGLLLQMLHPAVLAGVWDHSNFRADMHGRLRRTARFIAVTTYGDRCAAETIIKRIRTIHDHVSGVLPDGTSYYANDPALLAWVHVTEAISFLDAWIRYAKPAMSQDDQDRYFAEVAQVGLALGADPVPRTRAEARELVRVMRPQLRYDRRTRKVARLVLDRRMDNAAAEKLQALTMQAGVDLLPDWAKAMHGWSSSPISGPLVRAGTFGMAQTLRWAFQQNL